MFKAVRQLLADLGRPAGSDAADSRDDERLAAAALLVHIVGIDGVVTGDEQEKLRALLRNRFDLSAGEAETLIDRARAADSEAVDLYAFTTVLKAKLDEAGRSRVIEMMWDMVYADGEIHEFYDNLFLRSSEILGVWSREGVRMKQLELQSGHH
jgi:uncharacterized tellurite resistance protein B-like protein